jgi:hypothetical protein
VLLESVRTAFVQGMHAAFLVSVGIALAGAVLAMLFLPQDQRPGTAGTSRRQQGGRD